MSTPESMHSFNPDKYQKGLDLRKQLAILPRFNSEQIDGFLSVIRRRENEYFDAIKSQPDEARKELIRNKEELKFWRGVTPSRPNFTVHKILDSAYMPILTTALECYQDPTLPKQVFIAYHDYASGIMEPISDLLAAEEEIEGISDITATEIIGEMEKNQDTPIPTSASSELYLYLLRDARTRAKLLIQDPTGLTLINQAVEEIRLDSQRRPRARTSHRILPYQEPQIMLAGAKFAQKAYQALYPLTD